MPEIITVTIPDLPIASGVTGDEELAVYKGSRLVRMPQKQLRGTRTLSGPNAPPSTPSVVMALSPILGDRWRDTTTGDEWKVTSLDPFTWSPDGNVKGEAGVSTVPGPPGPPGRNVVGPTGPTGARGLTGDMGPVGPTGPEGPRGATGLTGPQGPQGVIGPTGPKGDAGAAGATGPAGAQGVRGLTGEQGPQGIQGDMGATGPAPDTTKYLTTDTEQSITGRKTLDVMRTKSLSNINSADAYARQYFTIDGADKWIVAANPTDWNLYNTALAANVISATSTGPVRFRDVPTFGTWTPYHTGNFDPNTKHPLNATIALDARNGEVRSWFAVRADSAQVYQFISSSVIGVYDTKEGMVWAYNAADKVFSVLGNEVWTRGNFDPNVALNKLGKSIPGVSWNAFQNRILITKDQQAGEAQPVLDVQVNTRNGTIDGGGGIGTSISLTTRGMPGTKYGQFGLLSVFENNSEQNAGDPFYGHVSEAPYMFVYKVNAPASWAIAAEVREFHGQANPQNGMLCAELTVFGTGTDNNNKRTMLFLPANKHNTEDGIFTEFAHGVFWKTTANTKYKNAMYLEGQYDTILNASSVNAGYLLKASGAFSGPVIDLHSVGAAGEGAAIALNVAHSIHFKDAENTTRATIGLIGTDILIGGGLRANRYGFTDQIRLDAVYDPNTQHSRIQMVRSNQHPSVYADFLTFRDTSNITAVGQGFGGVSTQVSVNNIVGAADTSQWNVLSTLKVMGVGAGQHCATYAQTFRYANTPAFTGCFEHRDFVRNPTVGNVAFELDMFGAGACNGGQRVALDIVYGGAEVYAEGDQVVSEAISISPLHGQASWVPGQSNGFETSQRTGRAVLLAAIKVKGNTVFGLDLSGMDVGFSYQGSQARGVRHANGLFDTWDNGGMFGFLNDKLAITMPNGGLQGGQAMPGTTVAMIKANIAGYGDCYIPLIQRT